MTYILLIISAIVTAAVAQQQPSLTSTFFVTGTETEPYGCNIIINNQNGWNNFTDIVGIHLEGFSNDDVRVAYMYAPGFSPIVPSIICETFPNLLTANFYSIFLTEIDDTAFGGCAQLRSINLAGNQIRTISPNAFANLVDLDMLNLDSNSITNLPDNVFANQANLRVLDLSYNAPQSLSAAVFQPLLGLEHLYLNYAGIQTLNTEWFTSTSRLNYLTLAGNRLNLSVGTFAGLEGLQNLALVENAITEIPIGALSSLQNLQRLYFSYNNLVVLEENTFAGMDNLEYLDLSNNQITTINDGAFRGLENLEELDLSRCSLLRLPSAGFEDLHSLRYLMLNYNEIEDLPENVFAPMPNLVFVGLWYNRLKTVRRNAFGSLTNLETLALQGNIINGMSREIIDDALNLDALYFSGNLCANEYFNNFLISRAVYLTMLERCFRNIRYIIETTTEGDEFAFFEAPEPGIAVRVNAENEVHISLTPFSVVWNPIIEIFIGALDNSRSIMRINEETDVVTVPTPNIITPNQWNDFRVTWANQVVLVFRANDTYPFMTYTMESLFNVNFYGLKAVDTSASWTVLPFDLA